MKYVVGIPGEDAKMREGGYEATALEGRLRTLAAKWRAQARHPQNRFRPERSALLAKHADELLAELEVPEPAEGLRVRGPDVSDGASREDSVYDLPEGKP